MQRSIINNILYLYFPLSATRKLPRLNSEPNGGGFDKEYDGGYGTKVSGSYKIKSLGIFVQLTAFLGLLIEACSLLTLI